MISDATINSTVRARRTIVGIFERLTSELTGIVTDDRLTHSAKAEDATVTHGKAAGEIDSILDGLTDRARSAVAYARNALDTHLGVTDDALAVKAAVYQGLLAGVHTDPTPALRVLVDKYADPTVRRLLVDTLEVYAVSADPQTRHDVETKLAVAHASGIKHVTERERVLIDKVTEAEEFAAYVSLIRMVTERGLGRFVTGQRRPIDLGDGDVLPGGDAITVDPSGAMAQARVYLENTEHLLEGYETHRRPVASQKQRAALTSA